MKKEITHRIPGGWYGNDPGWFPPDYKLGNVVIDPALLVQALTWLKRRAEIIKTEISSDINPGIILHYHLR